MGITRAQIARQLLAQGGMSLNDAQMMAPDGEFLAYINPKEAQMLKDAGGSGIMTPMGIPSYMNLGNEQQMNENLSAAGGGRGGSQNQTGGDTDDIYQQSSNTNQAIAKANRSIGQKIVDSIKNVSNFTPFGIARKGLGFLFDKFQNLRGFNPDGTRRTQAEFERARDIRRAEKSISNIMGRNAPFTDLTLDRLEGLYESLYGKGNVPSNINDSLIGSTNQTRSATPDDVYPDPVDGIISQVGTNPNVKSMMGEYFNVPIENRIGSTSGYNVNDIRSAKTFGLEELLKSKAVEPGSVYGYNLTDQGKALERFRKDATGMNNPSNPNMPYKGLGVQFQLNQLLKNENTNVKENQDYIQEQINKGFLQNPEDFINQKALGDYF